MNLAIFLDAHAVSGDATLLDDARALALDLAEGSEVFIARLADAINQFREPPTGFFGVLNKLRGATAQTFDLKKLGTFPIVHGVRALALEHRLAARSSVDRLHDLASQHALTPEMARDLEETLHLLMTLKLRNNLRQIALGQPVTNLVELADLSTLEHGQLDASSTIIRQFRLHLQLHFRLNA